MWDGTTLQGVRRLGRVDVISWVETLILEPLEVLYPHLVSRIRDRCKERLYARDIDEIAPAGLAMASGR